MRISLLALLVAAAAILFPGKAARAFDDAQFCVVAKEYVRAVAGDVGTWMDRFTRNDGVEVGCDMKLVHFKRFYKAPSGPQRATWKENQAEDWESAYCSRSIWRDAVENGWVVSATVTTQNGERVWLACLPNGRGFYRVMP